MTEICYSSDEAAEKLGVSETVLVRLSQYFKIPVDAYESEGFLSFKGDLSFSEQDIRFFRMVRERLLEGESLEDVKTTLGPAALALPQGAPRSDAKVKAAAPLTVSNNPEQAPAHFTMEPRAADFTARRPENYTSPVTPPARKGGLKEGFKSPAAPRGVPTASRIASTFSSFLQEEAIKEVSIISKNKLNETTATREKPGKPVYSGQAQSVAAAQPAARIPAPTKTSATPPKPTMKPVAAPLEPAVATKPQPESFEPESFAFQPVSPEELHPEDLTPPSGNTPPPVLVSMTQSPAYQKMAEKTFARYKGAQNPRKPSNVLKNMMREMKNAPEPEEFNPAEFTSHEHPVNPALQTNELFTGELTPQKMFSWDNYVGDPAARRAPGLSRNLQDAVMQFRQQAMQTP